LIPIEEGKINTTGQQPFKFSTNDRYENFEDPSHLTNGRKILRRNRQELMRREKIEERCLQKKAITLRHLPQEQDNHLIFVMRVFITRKFVKNFHTNNKYFP
jgi:hypothetical protein